MIYPKREEFKRLAAKGNVIPVYRELLADMETPVSAFLKIDRGRFSYLLESVEGQEKIGRYSFLGSQPSLIFRSKGRRIEILRREKGRFRKRTFITEGNPLEEIRRLIKEYRFVSNEKLPRFCGGLVGYIGYDMVRFFEEIPDDNPDEPGFHDAVFFLTDTILIFDHVERKIKVVYNACLKPKEDLDAVYDRAQAAVEEIACRLLRPLKSRRRQPKASEKPASLESNMSRSEYKKAVNRAKEYIRSGDIIQTVISQRFKTLLDIAPFDLYRALRIVNPSPYMYYLNLDGVKIVGSSPEVMVRCEDGVAEVRPIAGTRPRGDSEEDDRRLSRELLSDPKELAEHIMLVDLGRNDLGRICRYGSVEVKELMRIEKYSHVMHIVSDVKGILPRHYDGIDLIRATFPAGTVTGAPKIRAMEIIDELENTRRGPYSGCVGYLSFSGNLDMCITIRTVLIKNGYLYIQAGAGIVADSVPETEYKETVNKARALLKALEVARQDLL